MTNFKNHRLAMHKHDSWLYQHAVDVIDNIKQPKPIAVQSPLQVEHIYQTDNNAAIRGKLYLQNHRPP